MSTKPTFTSSADLLSLQGKTAIVTGAAQGMGQGIALRLANAGAALIVTDIRECAETVAMIIEAGGRATSVIADSSSLKDAERVASDAVRIYGGLDIIVNNAAAYQPAEFTNVTEAQFDQIVNTGLKGVFFNAQAAAREMIKAGKGGRIINIGSTDAFLPVGAMTHYDAVKGGVLGTTRGMAKELGRFGITVNAVCPGGTDTPNARIAAGPIMKYLGLPEDGLDNKPRAVLGRPGTPDDIGRGVLFFASDLGAYATGVALVIDGGYLLV
jgi:glucose 1-dehydrogenase/2-deoxy-D-gluconate 3-dehydrogenase